MVWSILCLTMTVYDGSRNLSVLNQAINLGHSVSAEVFLVEEDDVEPASEAQRLAQRKHLQCVRCEWSSVQGGSSTQDKDQEFAKMTLPVPSQLESKRSQESPSLLRKSVMKLHDWVILTWKSHCSLHMVLFLLKKGGTMERNNYRTYRIYLPTVCILQQLSKNISIYICIIVCVCACVLCI